MNKPEVSIIIITYNQEQFIKEAIVGVLKQQTTFSWELIIANDCSTDRTDSIIKNYSNSDSRIKYILNTENLGPNKNFINAYYNCSGQYIAICEGDDYWTDPLKLQKQIVILRQNKTANFCFHIGDDLKNGEIIQSEKFNKIRYRFKDFAAKGCFIRTMSFVFRNSDFIRQLLHQEWVNNLFGLDHLLFLSLLLDNSIAIAINESMGVYRQHPNGIFNGKKKEVRAMCLIRDIEAFKAHLKLNRKQKYLLNWQLKRLLIASLYDFNSGNINVFKRALNVFINRIIFVTGPGILSGMIVDYWMKRKVKKGFLFTQISFS